MVSRNASVVLIFSQGKGPGNVSYQHYMTAHLAWYLMRDLRACGLIAHMYPADQYGRRSSLVPIELEDIDLN